MGVGVGGGATSTSGTGDDSGFLSPTGPAVGGTAASRVAAQLGVGFLSLSDGIKNAGKLAGNKLQPVPYKIMTKNTIYVDVLRFTLPLNCIYGAAAVISF